MSSRMENNIEHKSNVVNSDTCVKIEALKNRNVYGEGKVHVVVRGLIAIKTSSSKSKIFDTIYEDIACIYEFIQ